MHEKKRMTVADAEMARICAKRNRKHAEAISLSDPEAAFGWAAQAHQQELEASAGLAITEMPTLGPSGDLVPSGGSIDSYAANLLKSGNITALHTEAACERIKLSRDAHSFELGADAAESVKAADSIEQMLIHQAAALHKHGMQFLVRASDEPNNIERCRLANTAARLLGVSQDAILTHLKKRTGGKQTVLVQHVSVNEGAQAVIGTVQGGEMPRLVGLRTKMGNPMREARKALALHPKCGAYCRTTGQLCRGPAMANGRCRMHGGRGGRPPTHGRYTQASLQERRDTRIMIWAVRQWLKL
jgi:hypothetical protein